MLLVSYHKNHCLACVEELFLSFLLGVSQFGFLCLSLNAFWVNFCEWYKRGVQFHSSACSYLVFLTPFIYYSQLYFLYRRISHTIVFPSTIIPVSPKSILLLFLLMCIKWLWKMLYFVVIFEDCFCWKVTCRLTGFFSPNHCKNLVPLSSSFHCFFLEAL